MVGPIQDDNGEIASMAEVHAYVTAADHLHYARLADGHIRLHVSHSNLQQKWPDLKFFAHQTIDEVKQKLYTHGGTSVAYQELFLRRGYDTILMDGGCLADYGAMSGMEIFIKDNDEHSLSKHGGLENTALVEKYRMTDEDYDKREGTVRAYKKEQLKFDPNFKLVPTNRKEPVEKVERPETPRNAAETFVDGARCEVNPGGRRGTVAFFGNMDGSEGSWVGIRLDEPQGMNDGTRKGKRYFEADEKYGCFARPENVSVGDFPERDPFAELDELEEDML